MVTDVVAMETVEVAMVIAGTEVVAVATTEVALSVVSPDDLAVNGQKKEYTFKFMGILTTP